MDLGGASPSPTRRMGGIPMELSKRKPIRLPDYDYSSPGAYFVTVCTHDRRCILSRITAGEGLAPPAVELSPVGQCVKEQILALPKRYPAVHIDKYVIMPNHVHLLASYHTDSGGASHTAPGGARASTRKIVLSSLQGRHGIGHAVSCFISSFSGINPIRSYSMWMLWRRLPLLLSGAPT